MKDSNDFCAREGCNHRRRQHNLNLCMLCACDTFVEPAPQGESGGLRKRAVALFRPPFRFEMGYIWDSAGEMVADNREDREDAAALPALRVRGWGRIKYLPESEALHDEAGRLIAEALTKGWPK